MFMGPGVSHRFGVQFEPSCSLRSLGSAKRMASPSARCATRVFKWTVMTVAGTVVTALALSTHGCSSFSGPEMGKLNRVS